jgi:hypothetical protein
MVKVSESEWVLDTKPKESNVTVCPLLGAASGSKLSVERFLEMTRENKEASA